ncbi:MAG: hypothetical protein K1X47_09770 [Cyclobacteriaceae bacterium]|nr:hypothetical protein [Cyclobacteriaceae bacterium]
MRRVLLLLLALPAFAYSQNLPYREMPPAPSEYNGHNVAARLIDGMGFRYYWATEGLRPENLAFKPTKESRTVLETAEHIHELSVIILHSVQGVPNRMESPIEKMDYERLRRETLENLKSAADLLRKSQDFQLQDYNMVFSRGKQKQTFNFFNEISGPVSDALWHIGQVVTLRRQSGNPITDKLNFLDGKLME